jgi:hypothetical protein
VRKDFRLVPEQKLSILISEHPAWYRLNDQLCWYDKKSMHNQKCFKGLTIIQSILAVLIPATSLFPVEYSKWIASLSGILIAVIGTFLQINQYATLWVTYRSTAEWLKHEKYLFLSVAGPYKNVSESDRLIVLAERIEEHISTENAKWYNETQRTNVAPQKGNI